jgi:hypothetical protein
MTHLIRGGLMGMLAAGTGLGAALAAYGGAFLRNIGSR